MLAKLRREGYEANLRPFLHALEEFDQPFIEHAVTAIGDGGLTVESDNDKNRNFVCALARAGFVEIEYADGGLTLTPVREDFEVSGTDIDLDRLWKVSKFVAIKVEDGQMIARNPLAACKVKLRDTMIVHFIHALAAPQVARTAANEAGFGNQAHQILQALAHAQILQPCDEHGLSLDDTDPYRRQWSHHDLLFHAESRLGRSGLQVGATWRFKGQLPEPPAVRENPWLSELTPLYRPHALSRDMSLFEAMETRRSIRNYSAQPLTGAELGEFLWRTMRIRGRLPTPDGEVVSRPYPNGGALYEQDLFVTVDACADIERGFYYYDPLRHGLCRVSRPDQDMALLIKEAVSATGGIGHPQILFTIASRFDRFNWKYSGMSYAAQLKNIGVIYQTMYLVATAMGIGACGLGLGNSDRFAKMTGLDWLVEGSIGEFMIGRPR